MGVSSKWDTFLGHLQRAISAYRQAAVIPPSTTSALPVT
jgi:hypothetical protein